MATGAITRLVMPLKTSMTHLDEDYNPTHDSFGNTDIPLENMSPIDNDEVHDLLNHDDHETTHHAPRITRRQGRPPWTSPGNE